MREHPKVFCSHRSVDKPKVLAIATRLREAGIDAWVDRWEIGPGDDLVAKINEGLAVYDVGLFFVSKESMKSEWVTAEVSTLIYQMIEEGKPVIPVILDPDAPVPPLLKPRARLGYEQVEQLIDAIYWREMGKPDKGPSRVHSKERSVRIAVRRLDEGGLGVWAFFDGQPVGDEQEVSLGSDFAFSYRDFLDHRLVAARKDAEGGPEDGRSRALAKLGAALGRALFPPPIAGPLTALLAEAAKANASVLVAFETSDPNLLAIPFEAALLGETRLLALEPGVRVLRRYTGVQAGHVEPLPGPLRILVAIGAPDEGKTRNTVLDLELELQAILDAVASARKHGNAEVEILEVGHPDEIRKALEATSYHVLHLSGHGGTGTIELENEEGGPVPADAETLAKALRQAQRPLPLVFLASCLTGTGSGETASLAQGLLERGVPMVLAMQSSVSDLYSTRLAGAFYEHLARLERPLPSQALALARQEVESARREALARGEADRRMTAPEFATPSLFCAGEEIPLLDRGAPQIDLPTPARPLSTGPVPLLGMGDLIGRRKELREALRVLRDDERSIKKLGEKAGVAFYGIGGLGKSALAGRVMQLLAEESWKVAAVAGRWSLGELATKVGSALLTDGDPEVVKIARLLFDPSLPDEPRLGLLQQLVAGHRVLLVLDNFESNLTVGGGNYLDPTTPWVLNALSQAAREGKILITCRYPVPDAEAWSHGISLPPLSPSQTRKLFYRLAALKDQPPEALDRVLRLVGGHPRVLEYLDAILRGGVGRVKDVERRLRDNLAKLDLQPEDLGTDLESASLDAIRVAAQDVMLDELLALAGEQSGDRELLEQVAVFPLAVNEEEAAYALGGAVGLGVEDLERVRLAVPRLAALSLLAVQEEGWLEVHRWSAQAILNRLEEERLRELQRRGGETLIWRLRERTHLLEDAVEGARLLLAAGDLPRAQAEVWPVLHFMRDHGQALGVVAFSQESVLAFPVGHEERPGLLREQADALITLGLTEKAGRLYFQALEESEALARAEPNRADFQRGLSVSYSRLGNLHRDLGNGQQALELYEKDLAIAEALTRAEPNRAEFQRDLSVSYNKLGDIHRDLGHGQQALELYEKSLAVREALTRAEPNRADFQRDLSVSYSMLGNIHRDLGHGQQALELFEKCLAIAEALVRAEPNRVDVQRDLSVSYNKLGDLHRDLGHGPQALELFEKSLAIRETLARAEPNRADFQRDLSVSYNRLGDLHRDLGHGQQALEFFEKSLAIAETLARAEPNRADFQRDLSVSYEKLGDLHRDLGHGQQALELFEKRLVIAEALARAEPNRADFQADVVISLVRLAGLEASEPRPLLERALAIFTALEAREALTHQQKVWRPTIEKMLAELEDSPETSAP